MTLRMQVVGSVEIVHFSAAKKISERAVNYGYMHCIRLSNNE
jgi:hypothetical protein